MSSRIYGIIVAARMWVAALGSSPKPHIVYVLVDDWGWNNAGYHRPNDTEVVTPNIDELVRNGIELDRHYVYHYCSPSRASLQSGRLPVHVGYFADEPSMVNPKDPISGFAGIPRNMTGIAEKMRLGGYRTHAVGKWDAGMATWDHTPMGRGYETWFGYYHHANDYWTQKVEGAGTTGCGPLVDLWNTTGPARGLNGTAYEEELFTEHTLGVLDRHDTAEPLFLFHAFHQIHTPLEVPASWEQRFSFLNNSDQRKYAAMLSYMDTTVGKIVAKLKAKGMWDTTLMVVSSDNGGPIYQQGGANNLPLRGGKFADWEGGVRVNAFVSGGAVPITKRGSVLSDYFHISDWYATFAAIAGVPVTDAKAAKALLPPVDGVDQSLLILGDAVAGTGNRTEIHHSVRALTQGRWKLITGGLMDDFNKDPMGIGIVPFSNWHVGYGPGTAKLGPFKNCASGCLFDVLADPAERLNVAWRHPFKRIEMKARLNRLNKDVFLRDRGSADPRACTRWDGFYGPFIDVPAIEHIGVALWV